MFRKIPFAILALAALPAAAVLPAAGQGLTLNGAGATFPFPLYSKWSQVYAAEKGVQINYQSIGSGGGIRQFVAKTVDFGASDGPMTDEQIAQAGGRVLHIPMVAGAVVPVYNLPGIGSVLNFAPDVLAELFEPQIVAMSPQAFTLSGIERVGERSYAQSWLVRSVEDTRGVVGAGAGFRPVRRTDVPGA